MAGMKILIVEARIHDDVTDALVKGAIKELAAAGVGFKRVIVPGIFEIPAVIRYAIRSMELRATDDRYAGYVALGCAVSGETVGYDHICSQALGGLQTLVLQYTLALGTGILLVDTHQDALEWAQPERGNAGGEAAKACLRMIQCKRELHL
ncbi:MAG: 6,7-dimethyl-8-ribityllumazine synthase [Alphaproteobacteria bacterium]|nr:6,7-dimethyl-8-ribityllumazine synthase [Alphaproteobacteria bacterium]